MDRVGNIRLIASTVFKCVSTLIQPRHIVDDVYVKRLNPRVNREVCIVVLQLWFHLALEHVLYRGIVF